VGRQQTALGAAHEQHEQFDEERLQATDGARRAAFRGPPSIDLNV
jgi:hypothetical protein